MSNKLACIIQQQMFWEHVTHCSARLPLERGSQRWNIPDAKKNCRLLQDEYFPMQGAFNTIHPTEGVQAVGCPSGWLYPRLETVSSEMSIGTCWIPQVSQCAAGCVGPTLILRLYAKFALSNAQQSGPRLRNPPRGREGHAPHARSTHRGGQGSVGYPGWIYFRNHNRPVYKSQGHCIWLILYHEHIYLYVKQKAVLLSYKVQNQ